VFAENFFQEQKNSTQFIELMQI